MDNQIHLNEEGTYSCEYCKETFRLKMALNNHKCLKKPTNKK